MVSILSQRPVQKHESNEYSIGAFKVLRCSNDHDGAEQMHLAVSEIDTHGMCHLALISLASLLWLSSW